MNFRVLTLCCLSSSFLMGMMNTKAHKKAYALAVMPQFHYMLSVELESFEKRLMIRALLFLEK